MILIDIIGLVLMDIGSRSGMTMKPGIGIRIVLVGGMVVRTLMAPLRIMLRHSIFSILVMVTGIGLMMKDIL